MSAPAVTSTALLSALLDGCGHDVTDAGALLRQAEAELPTLVNEREMIDYRAVLEAVQRISTEVWPSYAADRALFEAMADGQPEPKVATAVASVHDYDVHAAFMLGLAAGMRLGGGR
jgi:hypothetical protein